MITKDRSPKVGHELFGFLILLIGILIGSFLTDPLTLFSSLSRSRTSESESVAELNSAFRPGDTPAAAPLNELQTLHFQIAPEHAWILQDARDSAVRKLVSTAENKIWVPATVWMGEPRLEAQVRLKGDLHDHFISDKWSLRVKLSDGKLFGTKVFSIQHPMTRGYLWEWLILNAARREGLLAPRSYFVNVVINNNARGIYYLEEHFSKELLESQQRREGPILKFSDEAYWDIQLQNHIRSYGNANVSESVLPAFDVDRADIVAFGEKLISGRDDLNRQLHEGLARMRALQNLMLEERSDSAQRRGRRALDRLRGETIDRFFDTDQLARAHALITLFQSGHALLWVNQRYYHNPVTSLLEPIVFDCNAQVTDFLTDLAIHNRHVRVFVDSRSYYNNFFRHLGRFSRPGYLDELWSALAPQLRVYESALDAESRLAPQYRSGSMLNRTRAQQIYLHETIFPVRPANFACALATSGAEPGMIGVRAWATTRVPVVVEGFEFGNGVFVRARRVVQAGEDPLDQTPAGGVILPHTGEHVRFEIPADERLAKLGAIREVKKAIRSRGERDKRSKFSLTAKFRVITSDKSEKQKLFVRKKDTRWAVEKGRPERPTVAQALARHSFLRYDLDNKRLVIPAGVWSVEGDLVIPRGVALYAGPGVVLRFQAGAVLMATSALIFEGEAERPVILEPAQGQTSWGGIAVMDTADESRLQEVHVRGTSGIARGGWVLTGGITFYRASVTMANGRIQDCSAEDGLNVIGTRLTLTGIRFVNCASDAFDGDFVTGTIEGCLFRNIGSDGVDVSGSDLKVSDCAFENIEDKAFSLGEASTVALLTNTVNAAMIGVASKDSSRVTIDGLILQGIANYALAAYIKKEEYGPSSIVAKRISIEGHTRDPFLRQRGCELVVDETPVLEKDLDVQQMYRDKQLGK